MNSVAEYYNMGNGYKISDLRDALKISLESKTGLSKTLNKIIANGPEITKALLEAFTTPKVLSVSNKLRCNL